MYSFPWSVWQTPDSAVRWYIGNQNRRWQASNPFLIRSMILFCVARSLQNGAVLQIEVYLLAPAECPLGPHQIKTRLKTLSGSNCSLFALSDSSKRFEAVLIGSDSRGFLLACNETQVIKEFNSSNWFILLEWFWTCSHYRTGKWNENHRMANINVLSRFIRAQKIKSAKRIPKRSSLAGSEHTHWCFKDPSLTEDQTARGAMALGLAYLPSSTWCRHLHLDKSAVPDSSGEGGFY